ncbi:MAG: YeeE/YedE thiosulfate transporter family protein [Ignavibacteria bacterium]
MGPLVPEVIGNELNFIVALFIGIAFGFILEQAGFSTSKKLVGLFYGYDFTVLRVFFTAGITAMIGVIALGHWGLLDISLVYINPTFLWSALAGGFIMGLGFVIGGFCPGTSVCAAAIGKIDAMIFVAGSFLGVMLFAEGYPLFEKLYLSESWGNVRVFESLGMSQSLFAFLLVLVAVGAFWATTFIEKKVNGSLNPEFKPVRIYYGLTAVAVIAALLMFALPDRKQQLLDLVNSGEYTGTENVKIMTPDELAFRIMDDDKNIQIFDFRLKKDFDSLSLPKSRNYTLENLFEKDADKFLSLKNKKNIFIADDEQNAGKAAVLAVKLGFTDIYLLQGGLDRFKKDIIYFKNPGNAVTQREKDEYRFRTKASVVIPEMISANKEKQKSAGENKPKRIVGGC